MRRVLEQENAQRPKDDGERTMREVTKVRALLGVLAVLLLVAFVAGCGLVPDQGQVRQQAKKKVKKEATDPQKKVEAKRQEVRKKVETGQEDLKKKVDDLKKKVQVAQEDVE